VLIQISKSSGIVTTWNGPSWKTRLQLPFFKLKNMDAWNKRRSYEDPSTSEESSPGQKHVTPSRNPPRFDPKLDHLLSRRLNSLARHHHRKADSDLSVSGNQHPIQAWRMKRCKRRKDNIVPRWPRALLQWLKMKQRRRRYQHRPSGAIRHFTFRPLHIVQVVPQLLDKRSSYF
jgi:hypothetical protein